MALDGDDYPGLGGRLRAKIMEHYGSINRFVVTRGYSHVYVYRWFKGMVPSYPYVIRLAHDLDVTPAWLLFGDDAHKVPTPPGLVAPGAGARGDDVRRAPRRGRATVKRVLVGGAVALAALAGGVSTARASALDQPRAVDTGVTTLRLIGRSPGRRWGRAA
jgi:hypothetical protein